MFKIHIFHSETDWFNQRLGDGGPVYTETNPDHFIVEPWNAISSLLIVIPALFWLLTIRKEPGNFKFLFYCIPLMILGGLGSTLFHAFRNSRVFLLLDILPTAILTLSLMIYFWLKVFKRWWYVFFVITASIVIRYLFFVRLPDFMAINISYIMTGILIGLPLLIVQVKTKFYKIGEVIAAILLFIIAILFRSMDSQQINFLPMGTHFLWHALTGFGAYFILSYLYSFRKFEIKNN